MTLCIEWETPRPELDADGQIYAIGGHDADSQVCAARRQDAEGQVRAAGGLDADSLMLAAARACVSLEGLPDNVQASLRVVDDETIRRLNRETRGIDRATDVLSFPCVSIPRGGGTLGANPKRLKREYDADTGCFELGDVVISLDTARAQAVEYGHGLARELAFLTAHALLHLMGYDHMEPGERGAMRDMERRTMGMIGMEVKDD